MQIQQAVDEMIKQQNEIAKFEKFAYPYIEKNQFETEKKKKNT